MFHHTDGVNNFVQVSVKKSAQEISINCTFMDRPINNKSCGIVYSLNCRDLSAATHHDVDVDVADSSNTITFGVPIDWGDAKNICFIIMASNNAKTVNVVGTYIDNGSGKFYFPTSTCNHYYTMF